MENTAELGIKKIGDREFSRLSAFIEEEVGIKLPPVKRTLLESRLQKRLKLLNIPTFKEYVDFVFNTPQGEEEIIEMIDAITTNKTDFMREPAHFEFMLHTALPEIVKTRREIKLWSVACSTGPEPYNMAMFMEEFIEKHGPLDYSITATDISPSVLEKAKKAIYPIREIDVVSDAFKKKYFMRGKGENSSFVRVKPFIRNRVRFREINLKKEQYGLKDHYDIVFCRNVLIYFSKANQTDVIRRLVNHMTPHSYLFLGHSESLAGMRSNLETVGSSVYLKE